MTTDHNLPTGAVTFLFSDIEASTPLWDRHRSAMRPALAEHDLLVKSAVESNGGLIVKTTGDGAMAAFSSPSSALNAALDGQHALQEATWSTISPDRIRVRMGLHTGEAELRAGDYYGTAVNRAARLMSIGHGDQILVSGTTARLLDSNLPDDVTLSALGQHKLKGLARPIQVFQVLAVFLPHQFPNLRTEKDGVDNLPRPLTSFVGREMELKQLDEFFAAPGTRLVTILGPGGMGKTQLSIAWARQKIGHDGKVPYKDGIHFIELASLESPDQVAPTMADVFAFPLQGERRSPEQQILDYLREKHMLLILDNFEHIIGASLFVNDILRTAPAVQLLVTSRERLHLRAEQIYAIEGLAYPPASLPKDADLEAYAAVQLLIRSAQRVHPNLELNGQDNEAVARICRTTAGMPLAIELAAAWFDLMPIGTIADEIEQRLDLLETEFRDMPERHRSIRAAIDITWEYLQPEQQQMFARLSIFRGGFTWVSAAAVLGKDSSESLLRRALSKLQDKSLLSFNARAERFNIHELLRQYGAEKLIEGNQTDLSIVSERHALFYMQLLSDNESGLKGAKFGDSLRLIDIDLDNILNAWNWLIENERRSPLAAAMDSLGLFHEIRGYLSTGQRNFSTLSGRWRERLSRNDVELEKISQDLCFLARVMIWQSAFELNRDEVDSLILHSLALLDDPRLERGIGRAGKAFAYHRLGHNLIEIQSGRAAAYLEQGLKYFQELEDLWGVANTLLDLGRTGFYVNSIVNRNYLYDAVEVFEKIGGLRGLGRSLAYLTHLTFMQGDLEMLEKASGRYLNLVSGLEQPVFEETSLHVNAKVADARGQFAQSVDSHSKLLDYYKELGRGTLLQQIVVAVAFLHGGQFDRGREMLRQTLKEFEERDAKNDRRLALCYHCTAMLLLAENEFAEAQLLLQKAIAVYEKNNIQTDLAGAQALIGISLLGQGELIDARMRFLDALKISVDLRNIISLGETLLGVALLQANQGELVRARKLYELGLRYPFVGNSVLYDRMAGEKTRELTNDIDPDEMSTIVEQAAKLDIWQESAALLDELEGDGSEKNEQQLP